MPFRQMFRVGAQVGSWLEQFVVVVQVKMMRLEVHQDKDRGHRGRELAEGVIRVLRLQGYARAEVLIVYLCACSHLVTIFPGSRCIRMERTAHTKLAFAEVIHRCPHGGEMRWAVSFKDSWQTRGIGQCPALIGIVTEVQARHIRITTSSQHCQAVNAVKHPTTQAYCLLHKHTSIGCG